MKIPEEENMEMNEASLEQKVKEILSEKLGVELDTICDDQRLKEDLNADSLEISDIIISLEEEFGIEVSNQDVLTIKTVGDLIIYTVNKML